MLDLQKLLSVSDFERAAQRFLPHAIFSFVVGGTEDGVTCRANREVFDALTFRPRGLANVSVRHQGIHVMGQSYAMPVGISPMGVTSITHRQCDLALAKAAHATGSPYMLSGASNVPLETIQQAIDGKAWYQGYLPGDTDRLEKILLRLKRAEIPVLAVTSDTAVASNRENNQRNGFTIPFRPSMRLLWDGIKHPRWSVNVFLKTLIHDGVPRFCNLYEEIGPPITQEPAQGFRGGRDRLDWDHMSWIRDRWPGKMVIKGIVHPADAEIAVQRGMDGVIVSNHGGRQLDSAMPALAALPGVKSVVPADFPIMIDSGFRRGTDVLKAIALGASMVFVGRPALYGASIGGQAGVARVLEIFRTEIDRNLALLGCADIKALDRSYLDPVKLRAFCG